MALVVASEHSADDDWLVLGHVTGAYGVKGWVRVFSYTETREDIIEFNPWHMEHGGSWQAVRVLEGKRHGKTVIARLDGCHSREQAQALAGKDIAVMAEQLPSLQEGEYYWRDLVGLKVINASGVELGVVDHLLESGANDVLVVLGESEQLIPYTPGHAVKAVDLENGVIRVDWDPEFD